MSNENGQEYEEKDGKSASQYSLKFMTWLFLGQSQLDNNPLITLDYFRPHRLVCCVEGRRKKNSSALAI